MGPHTCVLGGVNFPPTGREENNKAASHWLATDDVLSLAQSGASCCVAPKSSFQYPATRLFRASGLELRFRPSSDSYGPRDFKVEWHQKLSIGSTFLARVCAIGRLGRFPKCGARAQPPVSTSQWAPPFSRRPCFPGGRHMATKGPSRCSLPGSPIKNLPLTVGRCGCHMGEAGKVFQAYRERRPFCAPCGGW